MNMGNGILGAAPREKNKAHKSHDKEIQKRGCQLELGFHDSH
jgi:hypothetical protein